MPALDVQSLQHLVMDNKLAKGFNVTHVPLEICLLQAEVAEFFQAWRHGQPDAAEELADVAIYVLGLAGITGIDLQTEIQRKIAKNAARRYIVRNGVPTKEEA